MSTFTVYFCGTNATSLDCALPCYHAGELISTLAQNTAGMEFVDWIIVDGPGSGNLQADEMWTRPGYYGDLYGSKTGAGWEEHVKHAINVIRGHAPWRRSEMTDKNLEMLELHGVKTPKPVVEVGYISPIIKNPDRKLTQQALQERKVEIFRKNRPTTRINLVGWSRGAVTCHMLANALHADALLGKIPVNIFAVDPVPGLGRFQKHRTSVPPNVKRYVSVFARDERSYGYAAMIPSFSGSTRKTLFPVPGRHGHVAGFAGTYAGDGGINMFFGPGKLVRNLAEHYLPRWGTELTRMLPRSNRDILRTYDEMIRQHDEYVALRSRVYTFNTGANEDRHIRVGQDWTSKRFTNLRELAPDGLFVNWHHRSIFHSVYPRAYQYATRRIGSRAQLEAIERVLPQTYKILDHYARTAERIGPR